MEDAMNFNCYQIELTTHSYDIAYVLKDTSVKPDTRIEKQIFTSTQCKHSSPIRLFSSD